MRQTFGLGVKLPVRIPVPHVRVTGFDNWLCLLIPASCSCSTWEAMVMAQVVRSMKLMKEIWTEFLFLSLSLWPWAIASCEPVV